MYVNFTDFVSKLDSDQLSEFFESAHINIIGYGSWKETNVKSMEKFILSSFQLTRIDKGTAIIKVGDKETRYETNSLFLYKPFELYSAYSVGEEPLEYSYICFDIYPFATRYKLEQQSDILKPTKQDDISAQMSQLQFKKIKDMGEKKVPGTAFIIKLALIGMLSQIISNNTIEETPLRNEKELLSLIHQAIKYTHEHLSDPIKLGAISRYLGVSDSLLTKSFQKAVHTSPAKFLTQYKIGIAEQYIRSGKYSIDEISHMLGYSSSSHFRTTYKKILGKNPQ